MGRGLPRELNLNELRHAFVAVRKATEPWQRGHNTASGRANSSSRCFLAVAVEDQESRTGLIRERLTQLSDDPSAGRLTRDVDV